MIESPRMPVFEWYWALVSGAAFVVALCGVDHATPLATGGLGTAFGWFVCAACYETDRYIREQREWDHQRSEASR